MKSILSNIKLPILLCIISFMPVVLCGQTKYQGVYEDLKLYYHWLDSEERDSVYQKAYHRYLAEAEHRDRAALENPAWQALEDLSVAFTEAFWVDKDYDKAFYIGFQLEEKLPQVSESKYPHKREAYYKLGEAYYLFLDFYKSIELLKNALAPVPLSFDDRANLDALNIMGVCYANIGQMNTSDNYFRATLASSDIVLNRPVYNAYALSHLGCNAMLTGRYDKAIALSETVWPVLRKETDNYGHLAGMCYCRGRSYLEKGDFKQASVWIDSLIYFANRDDYNYTKRIKQAYSLQADYYTAMGDASLAKVYNDSLVSVYRREELGFTSQYIVRAAYDHHNDKISAKEARIRTEHIRVSVILAVATALLVFSLLVVHFYRRKNAAYKILAQKAQEWAMQEGTARFPSYTPPEDEAVSPELYNEASGNAKRNPTEDDLRIMALADHEMMENHAYREAGLTAESLSDLLGVHRNTLARAVNRTTGGNFSLYINGFRIKEAIRIISQTSHRELYIEELSERVGFGNRNTFSRVFKQYTGLSPFEFQKQKGNRQIEEF